MTSLQERILEQLREVNAAQAELDACHKDCEYDADYFCARQLEARDAAAERFFDVLDEHIVGIVDRAIDSGGAGR